MKDDRASRLSTLVGLAALIATAGIYAFQRTTSRASNDAGLSVDADLRDAVAEPANLPSPAAARIDMGRPVPVSWFATPESRHAELDRELMSARRRRALAQVVSVQ